jgi:dTDP-4-dehydrorhamnose 3,5-epimerase
MIDGVVISPRRIIPDERGKVMHAMKATDPEFEAFGEIYFSMVYPGAVKGWHLHRKMVLNYVVPVGQIKLVLYDDRPDSRTRGEIQELYVGTDNYCLVRIPMCVWNGFKGIGVVPALVANCATTPHDPDEMERQDPHGGRIPYDWARRDR